MIHTQQTQLCGINLLKQQNTVICATMRYPTENILPEMMLKDKVSEIIYTCRKAKMAYVTNHLGKKPDIWIDDNPDWLYDDAL